MPTFNPSTIFTTIISNINTTIETKNSTAYYNNKSSSTTLSNGIIFAIVIPCIGLIIGAIVVIILSRPSLESSLAYGSQSGVNFLSSGKNIRLDLTNNKEVIIPIQK